MDVELAKIAAKLQIRMPYVRGEKNDRRMANDFLSRLRADAARCLVIGTGSDHVPFAQGAAYLDEAQRKLISWGNRASHTFDVVRSEAQRLIEACARALDVFRCSDCARLVYSLPAENGRLLQCQCGHLRWRLT